MFNATTGTGATNRITLAVPPSGGGSVSSTYGNTSRRGSTAINTRASISIPGPGTSNIGSRITLAIPPSGANNHNVLQNNNNSSNNSNKMIHRASLAVPGENYGTNNVRRGSFAVGNQKNNYLNTRASIAVPSHNQYQNMNNMNTHNMNTRASFAHPSSSSSTANNITKTNSIEGQTQGTDNNADSQYLQQQPVKGSGVRLSMLLGGVVEARRRKTTQDINDPTTHGRHGSINFSSISNNNTIARRSFVLPGSLGGHANRASFLATSGISNGPGNMNNFSQSRPSFLATAANNFGGHNHSQFGSRLSVDQQGNNSSGDPNEDRSNSILGNGPPQVNLMSQERRRVVPRLSIFAEFRAMRKKSHNLAAFDDLDGVLGGSGKKGKGGGGGFGGGGSAGTINFLKQKRDTYIIILVF